MKSLTTFSVDMHLLDHYESNFAHLSDLYSLVVRLYKSERRAKKLENERLDAYLQNLHTFVIL